MNTETTQDLFSNRKGQSAIEYLMTYGWMLLVVAIVGGAIFATVQGQCQQASSGFSGTDVRIADFGVTANGDLQMQLRNGAASPITIQNVTVQRTDVGMFQNSTTTTQFGVDSADIGVGGEKTFNAGTGFSSVDGCNTFDVSIIYDVQGGLENQKITGTLTDSISAQ